MYICPRKVAAALTRNLLFYRIFFCNYSFVPHCLAQFLEIFKTANILFVIFIESSFSIMASNSIVLTDAKLAIFVQSESVIVTHKHRYLYSLQNSSDKLTKSIIKKFIDQNMAKDIKELFKDINFDLRLAECVSTIYSSGF